MVNKPNPILSEPFLLLSILATLILVVQDLNGILQLQIWSDPNLWFGLLQNTVRYSVVFLMGILSHVYKTIQSKYNASNEQSAAAIAAEKQEIAVGYTRLRDLCLSSNNPDLISAAKDESIRIVNVGVDLFAIAQEREIRLRTDQKKKLEASQPCPQKPQQPQPQTLQPAPKLTPPQKP